MSESDRIQILYDHYKDTCVIIGEAVKRRDRAMLFAIVAAGFFALQAIFPGTADSALLQYLNFEFGLTQIDLSVLGNLVWVLVLMFALRYFQLTVFVERQYAYLHQLEEKIDKALGGDILTREGKSYLAEYPWFSNWMSVLYTVIFTMLLLFVTVFKLVGEWRQAGADTHNLGLLFDAAVCAILGLSILLYIATLHLKKKADDKRG